MRLPDLLSLAVLWLLITSAVIVGQLVATWISRRGPAGRRVRGSWPGRGER